MDKEVRHSCFFQNKECEFFPCHRGVPEEEFNCLFCYCPLYALGKACGGNCRYTEKGVKSCKDCSFPHRRENFDKINERYKEIMEIVKLADGKCG